MRIALLSDIHGNSIALDAVLNDLKAVGHMDGYWILGDLCAIGHDPVGVLERVAKLPNAKFVRGNTDRYIVSSRFPEPSEGAVLSDPTRLAKFAEVQQSFAWTQGAITATGWFDWVAALPLEHRLTLPDGTRVLLVHAAPGTDDGHGVYPTDTDAELQATLRDCAADLVCVGHNHVAINRSVAGARVINPGSISNPLPPDLRAKYALLTADTVQHQIEFRSMGYDHEAVIEAVNRSHHPAADYITQFLRGQVSPLW